MKKNNSLRKITDDSIDAARLPLTIKNRKITPVDGKSSTEKISVLKASISHQSSGNESVLNGSKSNLITEQSRIETVGEAS